MRYLFKKKSLAAVASVMDAAGRVLFFKRKSRSNAAGAPRHILIIRLDHLGDVLFATGVPQSLKENFSGAKVTFLTSNAAAALLENNPYVDQVLTYDAPWFKRSGISQKKGPGYFQLARKIRTLDLDLALSLRGDLRENFLTFLGRVPERVGYGVTGGGFFLTHELKYAEGVHERHRTLDVLRHLGITLRGLKPQLFFSEREEALFEDKLKDWGLTSRARGIGVQLEAGTKAKEWPQENVDEFLKRSAENFPQRPYIFLGTDPDKKNLIQNFLNHHPGLSWTNLIGRTSLRELLWLIRRLDVFVGPDSGPAHAAACFGIPTLFLYSGTNRWEEWKSLEENADFLRQPVPCSPCHEIVCPVEGHPCMAGLKVDPVLRWIEERSHG